MDGTLRSPPVKAFLAAVIGVLLVAGGLAVALANRPVEVRRTTLHEAELRPGQTEVTGIVTFLKAEPADAPPLPLPVTITVPQRGAGGATISQALTGSKRVSIVWDGGTPLLLKGTGTIDVTPAAVEVSAGGVRWLLDGHATSFAPGTYTAAAPVAVGATGLARPQGSATFTADADTGLSTHGGAAVTLPLGPLALSGPGAVALQGRLRIRTPDGTTSAERAAFGSGPYELRIEPTPEGIRITGLLQGPRTL